MANQWFRLYAEFATDPKVQMLSEPDQRRYIMLLCMRCSNGDVTLHDSEVAFQLRISNEEWAITKSVLTSKGIISDSNQPTAWDKRQYHSDSSAERVRRHREEKKRSCNVTVTPPDTDTDTEVNPIVGDADSLPAKFVQFWESWPSSPRKVAKAQCAKKWRAAKLDRSADQIIAHVVAMKGTKQWQDGFDPAPLTYLNQQRWRDGAPCQTQPMFPVGNPFAGCQ